ESDTRFGLRRKIVAIKRASRADGNHSGCGSAAPSSTDDGSANVSRYSWSNDWVTTYRADGGGFEIAGSATRDGKRDTKKPERGRASMSRRFSSSRNACTAVAMLTQ